MLFKNILLILQARRQALNCFCFIVHKKAIVRQKKNTNDQKSDWFQEVITFDAKMVAQISFLRLSLLLGETF